MTVVRVGRTEVAEIEPGQWWCATGPLREVEQIVAAARQHGPIARSAPQAAGNGLVLVNFRRTVQPQQRVVPSPAQRPAPRVVKQRAPWWQRRWKSLVVAATALLLLAGLGVAWLVAHLDEIVALAVKVALTLLGIGLMAVLIMAGISGGGGSGHCPGPFHK